MCDFTLFTLFAVDALDFLINADDIVDAAIQTTASAAISPPAPLKNVVAEPTLTGIISSAVWREATEALTARAQSPKKLPVAYSVDSAGQDDPTNRPYRVQVAGHQRINVSIVDFAVDETLHRGQPIDSGQCAYTIPTLEKMLLKPHAVTKQNH